MGLKELEKRVSDAEPGSAERAPFWKPEKGDTLAGTVVRFFTTPGYEEEDERQECAELARADGERVAVNLVAVLRNEFSAQGIREGWAVAMKYHGKMKGKGGKSYHAFAVVSEAPATSARA